MEDLTRDNSKLIVEDFFPIDLRIPRHQMRLPLEDQTQVPKDEHESERDDPQRSCPFISPKALRKTKQIAQAENKQRRQGEEVAIAGPKYSTPPRIESNDAVEGNHDRNASHS